MLPAAPGRRALLTVLVAALVTGALKVWVAAATTGTNDVINFNNFAQGVRTYGPIRLYGERMGYAQYNHPPLTGWMLAATNWLTDRGIPFELLIRLPATLADVGTALLIFELVRRDRPLWQATTAGIAVAASPILFIVSGFHGNTDPVFVMFSLLSLYLLVTGRPAALAGICAAVAISIKIVPIVVLPLLLLVAWRRGRSRLVAFLAGGAAFMAVTWIPVVVAEWEDFAANVLRYNGYGERLWGLPQFAKVAGLPPAWQDLLVGPGRFVILAAVAGVPVLLAWRRPDRTVASFGLILALMTLLSTATATQYLAWAAAPLLVASLWGGVAYNLVGGAFLYGVYSRWNGAPAFDWDRARSSAFTPAETLQAAVVWAVLLLAVIDGLRYVLTAPRGDRRESALGLREPPATG